MGNDIQELISDLAEAIYSANIETEDEEGNKIQNFSEELADSNIRAYLDGMTHEINRDDLKKYKDQKHEEYEDYFENEMKARADEWNHDTEYIAFQLKWKAYIEPLELERFLNSIEDGNVWNSYSTKPLIKAFLHETLT